MDSIQDWCGGVVDHPVVGTGVGAFTVVTLMLMTISSVLVLVMATAMVRDDALIAEAVVTAVFCAFGGDGARAFADVDDDFVGTSPIISCANHSMPHDTILHVTVIPFLLRNTIHHTPSPYHTPQYHGP